MPAHRLARPGSKLACSAQWLADDVSGPAAHALARAHLYRALDFLLSHSEALEQEIFFRTADLFNAEVDLIFWDTTTLSWAIDEEADESEPWQTRMSPALRTRGHNQEGRDNTPQVVVGLALTRDGLPVRSWVFPGKTADGTTMTHLKDDVRGWRFNRCVFVGDRGMFSAAHRQRLSRALGRYILAVPMRTVTEVSLAVLTRPGRYRAVAPQRRVQEVYVGEGERRRRDVICHNPEEAAREQAHRARLLELGRAALAARDVRQADHPKKACELMASRRCGRSLRLDARGRLSIETTKVAAEAQYDGTFVVTTNDDTRAAADVALGYRSMTLIEIVYTQMTTKNGFAFGGREHPIADCHLRIVADDPIHEQCDQWSALDKRQRVQRGLETWAHRFAALGPRGDVDRLGRLGIALPQWLRETMLGLGHLLASALALRALAHLRPVESEEPRVWACEWRQDIPQRLPTGVQGRGQPCAPLGPSQCMRDEGGRPQDLAEGLPHQGVQGLRGGRARGAARAQRVPHGIGTASAEGIMIARGQGATAAWASTLTTAPHAAQSVLIGRLMAAGHVHVALSTALGRFTGLRTNERWHRHGTLPRESAAASGQGPRAGGRSYASARALAGCGPSRPPRGRWATARGHAWRRHASACPLAGLV